MLVLGVQHPFSEKSGVERRRIALPLVPCTPTRSHDKRDLTMKAETLRTACTHAQRALAPVHTHRTARQGLHTHKEGTRRPGSHPGTEQDSGCGCRRRKEKPPSCSEAAAAAHERGLRVVRLARASGGRQPHQHQRGRWHGWLSRALSLSLSLFVCVSFHRRGRGPPTSSSSSCGGELPSQQFSMVMWQRKPPVLVADRPVVAQCRLSRPASKQQPCARINGTGGGKGKAEGGEGGGEEERTEG